MLANQTSALEVLEGETLPFLQAEAYKITGRRGYVYRSDLGLCVIKVFVFLCTFFKVSVTRGISLPPPPISFIFNTLYL